MAAVWKHNLIVEDGHTALSHFIQRMFDFFPAGTYKMSLSRAYEIHIS